MQQPVEHTRFRGSLPERRELLRPVREFMPLATGQVRRLAVNGNPEEESSECSAFEQLNSEQPRGPNPSSHRKYMVRYFLIVLPEAFRRTPNVAAQTTVSTTSQNPSTFHGKYSGDNTRRISQANGYPYHSPPSSVVFVTRPVRRVITNPPTTEKITILLVSKTLHTFPYHTFPN
jgi:hypothetical protein